MGKSVFIAEKPSVAQEFAKALHANFKRRDGFIKKNKTVWGGGGGRAAGDNEQS